MSVSRSLLCMAVASLVVGACGADDGPTAAFVTPAAGASVAGSVELEMSAEGVTIEEAGEARSGAGHIHVIADAGCVSEGEGIAKDADHVHFGKGQTTGRIYLEPGSHDLFLQVGDGVHQALDITDRRTVEVGITDEEGLCDVVTEIDDLFDEIDNSSDEFAVKQIGYENIRRLAAQMADGLDVVDASDRGDLEVTARFVDAMTSVFVDTTIFAISTLSRSTHQTVRYFEQDWVRFAEERLHPVEHPLLPEVFGDDLPPNPTEPSSRWSTSGSGTTDHLGMRQGLRHR